MEKIEMAQLLQQKANISLEEAKAVLEKCDWDLLDAMILLEKEGKAKDAVSHGSSVREDPVDEEEPETESAGTAEEAAPAPNGWQRFCAFVKKLLGKGMDNRFIVRRNGSAILDLPVLVAIVLMILLFWLTVILLVVGLFTHCEYSFQGPDLGRDGINDGFKKASDTAQNIADQFKHKEN